MNQQLPETHSPAESLPAQRFHNKTVAGSLAAWLGWTGAHWFYLGRKHGWVLLLVSLLCLGTALRHDEWYFHPAFFVFLLPLCLGFIEALIICLTPDERWDARHNAGQAQRSNSGWGVVITAILTLMVGATVLTTGLVLLFQGVFEGRL